MTWPANWVVCKVHLHETLLGNAYRENAQKQFSFLDTLD